MAPNGAGRFFFRLIQTLPTFWATRILILRIFIFWIFLIFPAHAKNDLGWPQMGPGRSFFRQIQTLPIFWAERILILRFFILGIFWDPKFPDFQIFKTQDFQVPRFPNFRIPRRRRRRTNSQIPTSLPRHPGIKYVASSPCCNFGQIAHCLIR